MRYTQPKDQYTPPRCEELDIRTEGVIAASLGENEDYPSGGEGITFP